MAKYATVLCVQKMTEIIRFRVTPAFYNQLAKAAEKARRDLSDFVRILVEDAVNGKKK